MPLHFHSSSSSTSTSSKATRFTWRESHTVDATFLFLHPLCMVSTRGLLRRASTP
jgi:hypothetical protein